jgi:hypothetical protein
VDFCDSRSDVGLLQSSPPAGPHRTPRRWWRPAAVSNNLPVHGLAPFSLLLLPPVLPRQLQFPPQPKLIPNLRSGLLATRSRPTKAGSGRSRLRWGHSVAMQPPVAAVFGRLPHVMQLYEVVAMKLCIYFVIWSMCVQRRAVRVHGT